jgi:transposase
MKGFTMYPSDLKDTQWDMIKDFLPKPKSLGPKGGRRPANLRTMVNGIWFIKAPFNAV